MTKKKKYPDRTYIRRGMLLFLFLRLIPQRLLSAVFMTDAAADSVGKNGRPYVHCRRLMLTLLMLRLLCGIAYRQLEGIAEVLVGKENAPDHTTIARRLNMMMLHPDDFRIIPWMKNAGKQGKKIGMYDVINLTIDGTGIAARRGGDWLSKKHGKKKRYFQLVAMALGDTLEFLSHRFSTDAIHESKFLPEMLEESVKKLRKMGLYGMIVLRADKAFDTAAAREACLRLGIELIVPVKKNATGESAGGIGNDARARDARIQLGGWPPPDCIRGIPKEIRMMLQNKWKEEKEYGKRWCAEIVFAVFKVIFGGHVNARKYKYAVREMDNKIMLYNLFRGM